MFERSRFSKIGLTALAGAVALAVAALAGCAVTEPLEPAPPVVVAPVEPPKAVVVEKPTPDPRALAEEARALLAQAETDIQRARARRALWTKAWEALVGARAALAGNDPAAAIGLAGRASEFAQLGLEQLAYPPVGVKDPATRSTP